MVRAVGMLLLMLCSRTGGKSQSRNYIIEPTELNLGDVFAGEYETNIFYDPGPIGILFQMARAFLAVVQPNPFPHDIATELIKQNFGAVLQQYQRCYDQNLLNVFSSKQIIYYEIGFIICTILGVVFVLLMPLLGLCFCLCRCCDNCGGEMHQRQKKNADCRRSCFGTTLFFVTIIITAGALCTYAANQNLTDQLKGVRKLVNSNFKDLHTFINATPSQIDYVIKQYNTTKNKALADVNNIGPVLSNMIKKRLAKDIYPALDGVLHMSGTIKETQEALENVSLSRDVLKDGTDKLSTSLTDLQTSLGDTLNDPTCRTPGSTEICDSIRNTLPSLSINADFSKVRDALFKYNKLIMDLFWTGYAALDKTEEMVQNETKSIRKGTANLLHSLTEYLEDFQSYFQQYYPLVEQYDFYRWLGGVAVCCSVSLILAFNYLGLLFGSCGLDKHASPTTRGCISNTGGSLLMAGVGISFIFSWLLMVVVVVTFIVGGNVEKLACQALKDNELFKVLDTPYLLNSEWKYFISGSLFSDSNINITFQSVYTKCHRKVGIYSALQLENLFSIEDQMNVSMYTSELQANLKNINVDLSSIVLLDPEVKKSLQKFEKSGIDGIEFDAYIAELRKTTTKVDLLTYANQLDEKAEKLPRGALENALKGHANNIRKIHNDQVIPLEQTMKYVKARVSSDSFLGNVVDSLEAAQSLINNNGTSIVAQQYLMRIMGYFQEYVEWSKDVVSFTVADCKPIANVVDTLDIVLCGFVVDSLNGFWFGLGCCSIFLIPSIILAVKLAKFYRRMDTEDFSLISVAFLNIIATLDCKISCTLHFENFYHNICLFIVP
uniref:Prominin 1 b n=1 Tax=Callorhinchus milii TaxID=7868 RepID=A0A4W3HVM0_CALMI